MKPKSQKNKGITLIKKSNQLIEARFKFDVWETRVFLAVLSFIRKEDEDFKTYRIWYKDVIKTFGLRSAQSYGLLRDASRSLMRKVFKVSNNESGFQRETEYHIIRSVNYLSEGERGSGVEHQEFIDITFDPMMKPLLLQLQRNFTAYDLRNVVKLGTYPVRVYELLKQYESIGERTLGFDEMKRMFELTDEYPLFANFFQKVIEPSVQEINAHTDLTITKMEKVKEGRKIVAMRFIFSQKTADELRKARGEDKPAVVSLEIPFPPEPISVKEPEMSAEVSADEAEHIRLFYQFQEEIVQKMGVTPAVLANLLETYTEEQVNQALRVVRRAKAAGQVKTSLAGFFVQALKNGYTDPKEEEAKRKAAELSRKNKLEQLRATLQELVDQQSSRINDRIREITAATPQITEIAIEGLRQSPIARPLIESREQGLKRPLNLEDFRQDKVLRDMVKGMMVEQERERFADIVPESEAQIRAIQQQIRDLGNA